MSGDQKLYITMACSQTRQSRADAGLIFKSVLEDEF